MGVQTVVTPAGVIEDCIEVSATTPLEPDAESIKFYCPNVALVADGDLVLHAVNEPDEEKKRH